MLKKSKKKTTDCSGRSGHTKKGNLGMNISIDIDKVTVADGKIIIDVDPNQKGWFDAILMAKNGVKLSDLKPKDEFKIGDEVFIVLEQNESGTKVIAKEFAHHNAKFGDNSDWKVSLIRKRLNNEYFKKIVAIIGEKNILTMDRDLTSLDGLDDYGTCTDKVSLLTAAEYAKYHKVLGLKSNYPNWWWLITPASTPSNDYARSVCIVSSGGFLDWNDCDCSYGVRPFLTLEPSISVLLNKD